MQKAPGAATGTLFYTIEATLVDDPLICPQNRGLAYYKVSVLGLNPTALPPIQTVSNGPALQLPDPGLTPQPLPDPRAAARRPARAAPHLPAEALDPRLRGFLAAGACP